MSTLSGLTTIRAHRQVDHFTATNDYLLDRSQRPAYLLAVIQRWLQTVLRLVVAILATVVVAIATQIRSDSGLTGASLITLMSFGDQLALIVQSYTQLETSIGAVARLKNFSTSTPAENSGDESETVDKRWPDRGSIAIHGVSASYRYFSFKSFQPPLNIDSFALATIPRRAQTLTLLWRTLISIYNQASAWPYAGALEGRCLAFVQTDGRD